jgi:glycosyltransferase involved in cell wall biosynthesis
MNIAVFCAYFDPHEGGVEKYVQKLFSDLKDINITIITSNSDNVATIDYKYEMNINRFKCWNIMGGTYPIIQFSEYNNIKKLFKNKNFDYIITHTRFFNTSIIGCVIAQQYNIKLIHFEHGTKHSPIKNPILHLFGQLYDHIIGKYIIKHSNKCIGISKASNDFIKHLYPKADTGLVYNSIIIDAFNKTTPLEQKVLCKNLGIGNSPVIVFVGRIIYAKGVQDLLEAVKGLDVKVVIVGNGNYLNTLQKSYPEAIYVGQQTDIVKYLSIATIFVNPSHAEGLPTSVLEAGALGIPCIATNVGGTNEIIDDHINGILYTPKDIIMLRKYIKLLLNNKLLCERFSEELRLKVRRDFSWNNAKKKFEELLCEI